MKTRGEKVLVMAGLAYTRNCTDFFRTVINETAAALSGEMPLLNRGANRRYKTLSLGRSQTYYIALSRFWLTKL